jgi:hypothetical protein
MAEIERSSFCASLINLSCVAVGNQQLTEDDGAALFGRPRGTASVVTGRFTSSPQ